MSALAGNSIRGHARTGLDLSGMTVESIVRAGGAGLFSRVTAASPLGSLGRNILRADGISLLNLGLTWTSNDGSKLLHLPEQQPQRRR